MKIKEFAEKNGYKDVVFLKNWNGYKCYEPIYSDEPSCTGLPNLIMVKGDEIRMSTPQESMEID